MPALDALRSKICDDYLAKDAEILAALAQATPIADPIRKAACARATGMVRDIRAQDRGGLMEVFLAEYGLSTAEGLALMRLAEALLRVPDAETVDALIEDKIVPAEWGTHRGRSKSGLVNASTLALMLTGRVLSEEDGAGIAPVIKGAIKRLGEPVIRTAVRRAMREMGNQFVLGETIEAAVARGGDGRAKGYTYSYDMLGEAAMTDAEAQAYDQAYAGAIRHLGQVAQGRDIRNRPGISIKLSALHPRYELPQKDRVMAELVPTVLRLAQMAKSAGMGFNIDAEEADRLDLSLDVIEAVLSDPALKGWDGFGVVVQAYGKRAGPVLDWLYALAERLDRRIMVRLVKGAYWDAEIKRAQVEGLSGFPVFTTKAATDVSYLHCAARLLQMTDRIYPQFATHNAHTVAAILEMADDPDQFEFQRLHGMGAALYDQVLAQTGARCRIYAPVGAHRDLLAYLVRRLLENGANSSFVHQIMDEAVPPEVVAADPFVDPDLGVENPIVASPSGLFAPERANSVGIDLHDPAALEQLVAARSEFAETTWQAGPILAVPGTAGPERRVLNPVDADDRVGKVQDTSAEQTAQALDAAQPWAATPLERAQILSRAADLYEAHAPEFFALLAREAGKCLPDCVAELREAVDFLRYYAARGSEVTGPPLGRVTCISPWNFPLAIFTGQIAAALAAGNAVLAKPAEATALIAGRAVALMHDAGVPRGALQLLPGDGAVVGAQLTADPRVDGVVFTGSTTTAQAIHRAMAENLAPSAPLIAETGGLNAMIVDSTALPEQAVRDIVTSAFQSAGQRCSALRCLYVQEDIADRVLSLLYGAMDRLRLGDPWKMETDVGPVIDAKAAGDIQTYIDQARAQGRVLKALPQGPGHSVPPTVIEVSGIADLSHEVFGPVLHVARFAARDLDRIVDDVNARGYGLTFGLHTRIDERIGDVAGQIAAGNLYVNRNQIGAIVGSQPFGGQGLSGTGPKAGGPDYVARFTQVAQGSAQGNETGLRADPKAVQARLDAAPKGSGAALMQQDLPGPTGELNRLTQHGRGPVLCLGPGLEAAFAQAEQAQELGCPAVIVAPGCQASEGVSGRLAPSDLTDLSGFAAVAFWGAAADARAYRIALAARPGAILPLITEAKMSPRLILERHLCVDTTAAGGNAALLASVA